MSSNLSSDAFFGHKLGGCGFVFFFHQKREQKLQKLFPFVQMVKKNKTKKKKNNEVYSDVNFT